MAWRLAKSLETLRAQINTLYPNRRKDSDGTIGDTAHAARASDHNPDAHGVVHAMDLTHDPGHGLDSYALAETLRLNHDPRISYVISNRKIFSSNVKPWTWRPYTGSNPHNQHVHVSVGSTLADDMRPWNLVRSGKVIIPPPPPILPQRIRMAKEILKFEARRDAAGHLAIYKLPPGDGGGTYEVAGINDKYHPIEADHLATLIRTGQYNEAERRVREFIANYTEPAASWHTDAGVQFYLRDCYFNRGPRGSARIFQRALGVPDDGIVGPITMAASAKLGAKTLLPLLLKSREKYERDVAHRDESSIFWKGLSRRWKAAEELAQGFSNEVPISTPSAIRNAGIVVGVGAVAGATAQYVGTHPMMTIAVMGLATIAALFIIKYWR